MNVIILSLYAGLFTYFFTFLGSGLVFFFKKDNSKILDFSLALSIGVMLSASFFSLLNPAIEYISIMKISRLNLFFGFMFGGVFLFLTEIIFNKKIDTKNKRLFMLFFAITMHNIPEGLAIGVAFGSIINNNIMPAVILTIGIALQNFPEGASISLPMKRDGISAKKAFFFGQISALVEPISSVIGSTIVLKIKLILPFLLSFAAGAMIYVTVCELLPEALKSDKKNLTAIIVLLGFSLMMMLDLI